MMKKSLSVLLAIVLIAAFALSACGSQPAATVAPAPAATDAPAAAVATEAPAVVATEAPAAATEAPAVTVAAPAEDTVVAMVPAASGAPFDIKGKTVCYIIPSLANPFLNGVATSVTEKFKADGVVIKVYGADEGGLNQQFDQIENCISMKVDFMYVMAAGEIDQLMPAIEQVKAAGIMMMGVPPQKLAPFDAIMHTSQLEDGQKVAKMACDFITAVYPTAADGSVETAIIGGASSSVGMHLRDEGYSTITDICPKVKLVAHVDISTDSIPAGQAAAENVLTANQNVKVFIGQSAAHARVLPTPSRRCPVLTCLNTASLQAIWILP